jgi:protein PhnA
VTEGPSQSALLFCDFAGQLLLSALPSCWVPRSTPSHHQDNIMDIKVRDSNGALLAEGDTVTLIKDLKLKGSSTVLKRGTVIKNIHLTDNEDEIEGRTDKVKGLVLRTEFLKKA